MKYRKKPVVIEAVQWTGKITEELQDLLSGKGLVDHKSKSWYITTLEGTMKASLGDYIIKGVQGELYPCKPDIFEQTYEVVEE